MKNTILFVLFLMLGSLLLMPVNLSAQSTSNTSPPDEAATFRNYEITSSIEAGVRGLDVDGNINKYRSDLNYKNGFRIFDSSFTMENKDDKRGFFDSLMITGSGWNGDPQGFARVNIEKMGWYRFDTKIRQVNYFNNLNNHTRNARTADVRHDFGDFDLTLFPQSEKLRLRFGASYNRTNGPGSYTARPFSDEYKVNSKINTGTNDFRAGLDTKLLGINMSLTYGFRHFKDNTSYSATNNPGFNITNTALITTFERYYPISGDTHYGSFSAQRTFAKKLDVTARLIYSITDRNFNLYETITGRDTSNNIINLDRFQFSGDAKRPETIGDLGVTYAVTNKFRISNTFSFTNHNISGFSPVFEEIFSQTASGGVRVGYPSFPATTYYRDLSFQRYINTVEGDYQFNHRFGVNIGYRYTHRKINESGYNFQTRTTGSATNPNGTATINNPSFLCPFTAPAPATTTNPSTICEEESNSTNTLIAGFKAKPTKNWVLYGDLEWGEADNAFTRLSNYNFTNLRVRSRWNFNRFSVNISGILKDNENPSEATRLQGPLAVTQEFISNVKSRIFSASVDWTPDPKLTFSSGYNYQHLTSETDIIVSRYTAPAPSTTSGLVPGFSQYFVRDHYAFFDVSAQPVRWLSFYASYRIGNDLGQGDRVPAAPEFIISSYPYTLHSPEAKVAIRLSKNIDWNIGYQYFDYHEDMRYNLIYILPPFTRDFGGQPAVYPPSQNYRAHLPYTSLRIYFGRRE